ncbi:MAG: FAD-dependent oxidoreductase [Candidatus Thiodiazotropha sp. (ex Lucinoma aequizonata)]|nr:FAD-dependent oxidoreductase [Candidatus Thiodiazotropha sp. (ex Lucinoma aequizonata)]MCU7887745.1 FAD-dependent oxidoreductase [Candidatus Thiodiazotropha sp. (ex Lucinoma aequizonata)]MCU7897022.1 FAD-dependent oxidoreductase [Candidatus Thiodiazotropha sp. (ex Lucinoma aequizonata)]MCU7898215.1 FAD-dependent oxidoreductase [Candidatus Thiodiazotropha sp. (ex Lucinoma aequizonata)]MCU7908097.1 FAD-dependent oxidoreductase [Candidatus Thiodiazotropha sp. (ex Lucinoma aequizonata)]
MNDTTHYVIIGNGAAGNEAAQQLRQRDPDSRITLVSAGKLLFLNRYRFPEVLDGVFDWREFLVNPPEYYNKQRIELRRYTWVNHIDPRNKTLEMRHKEKVGYDKLLVASGAGGYLPEYLGEYSPLLHDFDSLRNAMEIRSALPTSGGKVLILGGDIRGLDLAHTLVRGGREVIVVTNEHLFYPHQIASEESSRYIEALERMGMEVIQNRKISSIEKGAKGMRARHVTLDDNRELNADVVMAFYGLMPSLNFMRGTGVDIERGLLVSPQLLTGNEHIWAAGDVCQIWSPEENQYRFYYGWKNVKMMGRIAAINMTGGNEAVDTFKEDRIFINEQGEIDSTFWEYE